jgi:hypothetical protein
MESIYAALHDDLYCSPCNAGTGLVHASSQMRQLEQLPLSSQLQLRKLPITECVASLEQLN